jgi:hypothetical protein
MQHQPSKLIQIFLVLSITGLTACGDEAGGSQDACGGCPEDSWCVGSPDGAYCQSPFTRDNNGDDDSMPLIPGDESNDPSNPGDDMDQSGGRGWLPGQGGDGSNPDNNECTEVRLLLKPSQGSIPRVMLVVDRSYSMVGAEDRWTPIESTLSRVTQNLGHTVHFGLVLFPSPNPNFRGSEAEMACAPGEVNVNAGANTAADINQWLANARPEPGLATPTHSALDAAGRSLLIAPTGNDYILLATDGGPGCNFALDPHLCTCLNHSCILGLAEMCLDDDRTANKVAALAQQGIRTIVLGIASDEFMPASRAVLDRMAVAGQTDLDGRHFEVGRVHDLEGRLTAAAGNLAPCTYDLGELAEQADQLVLSIDGQAVPRDRSHRSGWDLTGSSVEFFGDSCMSLRDGGAHEIAAGCH